MTGPIWVAGFDPGPTTGLAVVSYIEGVRTPYSVVWFQVRADDAALTLIGMLAGITRWPGDVALCAGEAFVARRRSSRLRRPADGQTTVALVERLREVADGLGWPTKLRRAVDVKPWASDKRLAAIGLTARSPHVKDAARLALYRARFDAGAADPLDLVDQEVTP